MSPILLIDNNRNFVPSHPYAEVASCPETGSRPSVCTQCSAGQMDGLDQCADATGQVQFQLGLVLDSPRTPLGDSMQVGFVSSRKLHHAIKRGLESRRGRLDFYCPPHALGLARCRLVIIQHITKIHFFSLHNLNIVQASNSSQNVCVSHSL